MGKLKLNSFQIKLFMVFLMVFDHIQITGIISGDLVGIFHVLTRGVGVWFAYGAVEGLFYTRDEKKYIARLFSWALIMFVGNKILKYAFHDKGISIHYNIFLTLAIGVLMLYCLKHINNKILKWISFSIIFIIGAVFAEGGLVTLSFMVITYFTYGKNKFRNIGYIILSVGLFIISFKNYGDISTTIGMLANNSEFMFILVIPFLYMYNGERGKNTKFTKYFFYIFYPLHLWLLATIGWLIA